MATEAQARLARDEHQDRLAASGAHSLSVEPPPTSGAGSFGMVAWVDNRPGKSWPRFPRLFRFRREEKAWQFRY
jgi:hypothetical protein